MTEGIVIDLGTKAVMLALYIAGPLLIYGLVAGLLVAVFQAVTSIQEMTLTFIPKILAVILAMVLFGNWMMQMTKDFTVDLLMNLPNYVR
ncbi:MAG TPA: flagellar biosynthesis protein FliQ [bacterium]|nr:flagellar biosynthesis protein FliQ [bacterium]